MEKCLRQPLLWRAACQRTHTRLHTLSHKTVQWHHLTERTSNEHANLNHTRPRNINQKEYHFPGIKTER